MLSRGPVTVGKAIRLLLAAGYRGILKDPDTNLLLADNCEVLDPSKTYWFGTVEATKGTSILP